MFGSLLRMATDVVSTGVTVVAAVAEPFVDLAGEAIAAADQMIVSPTADVVGEVCDSVKDIAK
ncbi:hypothetical protein pEaSNUABM56_00163 [Erwinia phage pEa_SNUABM_56]|uniref:Putative major capsid protein n=1 Tax=Erwinia phage pEp_SNUABM_01 TaxID=2601643 RepID=A0A5J6DB48_9CAUD|nr:putative major capsid protein [Erwinia phage pEp_SNUABM_01]QEQ94941.1 putative major capsid protein [Erwinia phage pEp_SNUABM_01]UYL84867.1 hypothetical protein pEaSNUABM55_00092 [Erwinia phage pEa_SNUABM_55]UYL85185.1 hypothetical protein pEaSNUABM56_00163 [Erwinia phage pEa_SNUABM_56]